MADQTECDKRAEGFAMAARECLGLHQHDRAVVFALLAIEARLEELTCYTAERA